MFAVSVSLLVVVCGAAAGCKSRKPGDESISVPLDEPRGRASDPKATPPKVESSARGAAGGAAGRVAQETPLTPKTETPNEARALSRAFASVAEAMRPTVVRIDVEVSAGGRRTAGSPGRGQPDLDDIPPLFRRFFEFGEAQPPQPQHGTGSGVVLDGAGHVITNRHVVSGATNVSVTFFDGREVAAKVVGSDSQTDVAVVKLEKPPAGLVAARLGDSDKLDVGEWVLAVGSPLGLDQTVTAGIVSGKGRVGRRVQMSGERVRRYIQTDAKINPGNSGGPLVNLNAEVVGINTLINTGPGGAYGFAIPVNQVRRVAEALIKDGKVRYPYLGVLVSDLRDVEPQRRAALEKAGGLPSGGAFVSGVTPGGPAAKAGLRAGDILTQIDNEKIEGAGDVIEYVSTRTIGSSVTVTYLRDGKKGSAVVTLGQLPEGELAAGEAEENSFGLVLQALTPPLAESLGLPPSAKGVVIAEVQPDSVADKAGLSPGEVIVEIDRRGVASPEEAAAALRAPRKGGHLLRVRGPTGMRFVTLAPG